MKNLMEKFYLIDKNILEAYRKGNFEETKKLIELENEEYKKIDIQDIIKFFDFLFNELEQLNISNNENFEVAIYNNDKHLITMRMYNKVSQIMNRFYQYEENKKYIEKDVCKIDKNLLIVTQNIDGAIADLEENILANIEIKYLYFMLLNNGIDNDKKSNVFMNTMYINPYLEEKLLLPKIEIDKFIKNEDELYFNLWGYPRDNYDDFIYNYCINNISFIIESMITKMDTDENTNLKFTYLRALFNYLDYETLENLKREFIRSEIEVENLYGERLVSIAFNWIERDNEIIRKIKTR